MKPQFFTFDIFGTVLDWRRGMADSVRAAGAKFDEAVDFDRIVDLQGVDEQRGYRSYAEIARDSLVVGCGLPVEAAARVGRDAGCWPLFADSAIALKKLMAVAPCVAMTNSDRAHGEQVRAQLGFELTDWVCAEESGVYKPAAEFWHYVARKHGVEFGRHWWHVSAYADYDLSVAQDLGLTCVFVDRPHAREGFSHVRVQDLAALAIITPV